PSQSCAADPAHPHAGLGIRRDFRGPGTFLGRHGHPIRHRTLRTSWWHDRQCVGGHAVAPGETLNKVWCLTLLACLALPAHAEWVRRVTDGIMGTRITVELWADDKDKGERAIDAVLDEMRRLDESMSTYKPTSEVSQVNAKAADGPMPITKELFDLLTTATQYSVLTEGAFDITYASVGYLYDFRKRVRPNEAQITKALPAVDYRHVLLDPKKQTVQF